MIYGARCEENMPRKGLVNLASLLRGIFSSKFVGCVLISKSITKNIQVKSLTTIRLSLANDL